MARATQSLYALNRGEVSRLGLARSDVKRLAMAAQVQTNWMPRVLGSMMLRPGLKYIGETYDSSAVKLIKFIFATNDTAILEMGPQSMRVWTNVGQNVYILARGSVATTIANGGFSGSLASWTDLDEAGAVSSWSTGMGLLGTGTNYAIREQQVSVGAGDQNVEHGLRIVISRGPVYIRVGSTSGDDDYLKETELLTGTHSLAITPGATFFVRFFARSLHEVFVASCNVEAAGNVVLPTPYLAADLDNIRTDQSGDVLFVACSGYQQRRIERRGTRPNSRSWSVVLYQSDNGPFAVQNTGTTTMYTNALTGSGVTLFASRPIFKTTHIGALFSITPAGQNVSATSSTTGGVTNSIRVTGISDARIINIVISGNAAGSTVKLQRSYDNATWGDVGGPYSWSVPTTTTYNDGQANQIVFYRLYLTRVAPDNVTMTLSTATGSLRGVVRVTAFISSASVFVDVLSPLGSMDPTINWQEGLWSDLKGWPTAVRLHEGRLWWFGQNGVWGSISDAFNSFDETFIGNAGPINRTVGSGPVDTINWAMSLKGLIIGTQGNEGSVRASSLDEPITPTNFNIKFPSTQGSGTVEAVKIDQAGYFVNRSRIKVFEMAFDLKSYDFQTSNIMELNPDIGRPGIVRMDAQRLPDTRLHMIRSDGRAIVAVSSKNEEVLALIQIVTDGLIEDVVTLPAVDGDADDQVYYVVNRTISGSPRRYIERWAQEVDCLGTNQLCFLADSFYSYSSVPIVTVNNLWHLEGKQVVVWADGVDIGTIDSSRPWIQRYTVSGGVINFDTPYSNIVIGLPYTAQFQSAKLGLSIQGMSHLNQQKRIDHLGLILANTHPKGLKYGQALDDTGPGRMDDFPQIRNGTSIGGTMMTEFDENMLIFPGTWTTDARVCLQAQAPRPATVLAITYSEAQYT